MCRMHNPRARPTRAVASSRPRLCGRVPQCFGRRVGLRALWCLAHWVTLIGVLWWIWAPSCAVNAVGINSFVLQRLLLAASADPGPSGNVSSNRLNGTSGADLKVLLVMPALL